MRSARRFLPLLPGIIALGLGAHLAKAAAEVGQPAPPLAATELDGGKFDLAAMRGKVVIINFWATWCGPCREEMPALNAYYRRHHSDGVELIGISADRPRDRGDVVKMMQSFSYPAAMLGDVSVNGFGRPGALPLTYVVDAAGVVRAVMTPDKVAITDQVLDLTVTPLLPGGHAAG